MLKFKRKRKNEDRRVWRWFLAVLLLLLAGGGMAGYLYWRSLPPVPLTPEMTRVPTATPFQLPDQCDVTQTYHLVVWRNGYGERAYQSPDGRYRIQYDASGIHISEVGSTGAPVLLLPAFADMYAHQLHWSPDNRRIAYLDGQKLRVANAEGRESHVIHEPVIEFRDWSPDGNYLVVNDGQVLWLAAADGSSKRAITAPESGFDYTYIYGWSPDSRYIVLSGNAYPDRRVTILPLDASQPVVVQNVRIGYPDNLFWSPDWRSVALFFINEATGQTGLKLVRLDGSRQHEAMLPNGSSPAYEPVVWSPDSQKIALLLSAPTGAGNHHATFSIYGLDGMARTEVGKNLLSFNYDLRYNSSYVPDNSVLYWSADSRLFYHWEAEGDSAALYGLDTVTGNMTLRFRGSVQSLYYAPGTNTLLAYGHFPDHTFLYRLTLDGTALNLITPPPLYGASPPLWSGEGRNALAIKGWHNTHQAILVINVATGQQYRLLPDNTVDAGDPHWSPLGTYVAATYATSPVEDNSRRVNLVWLNVLSGKMQTLADDFRSVYNLVWSPDERYLAYVVWRDSGTSLERLDTASGATRVLLPQADTIHVVSYDESAQRFTAIYETDETLFYSGFTPEGESTAAIPLSGDPYHLHFFPSPAGGTIAVKGSYKELIKSSWGAYKTWYEMLLMVAEDGSRSSLLAAGLTGLGDPSWSPDGRLMAYTRNSPDEGLWLRITDADGEEIWQTPLNTMYQFEWQPCS